MVLTMMVLSKECFSDFDSVTSHITTKVKNTVTKLIWPSLIAPPKRGVQWEIFFEPVIGCNSETIPSTFVIVIYIAPCLGGVFTEEPEHYEIIEGVVKNTWETVLR